MPRGVPRNLTEPLHRLSREDLAAVINSVSEAMTVQRPDGRVVWANDAAARMLGFDSPEDLVATSMTDFVERFGVTDEFGNPFPPDELPGRVALNGQQTPETLLRWRPKGEDGERWSLVRATPVFDKRGRVRYAVNIIRDVTARQLAVRSLQRTEERLSFLASASRALLGASLDPEEIAERLVEICVPLLGDRCSIWEKNASGQPDRLADRAAGASQSSLELEDPPPELVEALDGQSRLVAGDGTARIAVPIPGRQGILGALLVEANGPHDLENDDLQLAEEVGRRTGAAIENALLYAERAQAAAILSQSLVPSELPEVPGLDLYGFVRPAASGVGGDFYDVVSLADGRTLLVIADVSGKGPEAAALTAMFRYTLRTLAMHHASPSALLNSVNEAVSDQLPDGRFCTLACGALGPAPEGIRASVVVAGHPKPLILRRSGEVEPCGQTGIPLGVLYRLEAKEVDVTLAPGDAFLLVTDGCVGEGSVGKSELRSALEASVPRSATDLAQLVDEVAMGVQPDHPDDVAALIARVPPE